MIKEIIDAVSGIAMDRGIIPAFSLVAIGPKMVRAHSSIGVIEQEINSGWPECAVDINDLKRVAKVFVNPEVSLSSSGAQLILKEGGRKVAIPAEKYSDVEGKFPELPRVANDVHDTVLKEAIQSSVKVLKKDDSIPEIQSHVIVSLDPEDGFIAGLHGHIWYIHEMTGNYTGKAYIQLHHTVASVVADKLPSEGRHMFIHAEGNTVIFEWDTGRMMVKQHTEHTFLGPKIKELVNGVREAEANHVVATDQWKGAINTMEAVAGDSNSFDLRPHDGKILFSREEMFGDYKGFAVVDGTIDAPRKMSTKLVNQALHLASGEVRFCLAVKPLPSMIFKTKTQSIMVAGIVLQKPA